MRPYAGLLVLLVLCLVPVPRARAALTAGTGITIQNNTVALATPVSAANGGTGATSLTAHGVVIAEGASAMVQVGGGACTTGQALECVNSGNSDPAFMTLSTAFNSAVPFAPLTQLTTSQTVYATSGNSDAQESNIQTPILNTRILAGFTCVNQAIQGVGNNIVVTLDTSACVTGASNLTSTTRTCTLTGAASGPVTCTSINGTNTLTAGNCFDFKVVTPAALTANAFVQCLYEISG
jgi:hypothetical protein